MNELNCTDNWYSDDDGFVCAQVYGEVKKIADFDCSDLDIDEREANKNLAIAAHDLYQAMNMLRFVLEDGKPTIKLKFQHTATEFFQKAIEAMNKAQGLQVIA